MKVLHVYKTYYPDPPGGVQEALRSICMFTQPLRFEHTIFTLSPTPVPHETQLPEARVVRARSWARPASCDIGLLDAARQFRKLSREADLIHYLFPWPFADVLHNIVRPKAPSVMTYISDVMRQKSLNQLYGPFRSAFLGQMRAIAVSSPGYVKENPVLDAPSLREKLQTIPFGIADFATGRAIDLTAFSRFGIAANKPYFLFLGALRYYKGLDYLLRAAKHVTAQIVIAGQDVQAGRLQAMAKKLGAENVVFTGAINQTEKEALLHQCFAFVFPSHLRSEAFGMALVEAAMFGKPMISCEIGTGTSFINLDGETGLVVSPADATALANAMNYLLHHRDEYARFGAAARLRYESMFNGQAMGEAYARFFRAAALQ